MQYNVNINDCIDLFPSLNKQIGIIDLQQLCMSSQKNKRARTADMYFHYSQLHHLFSDILCSINVCIN